MNLCRDCKHYQYEPRINNKHLCILDPDIDRVTGRDIYKDCYEERENVCGCGLDGRNWEERNG